MNAYRESFFTEVPKLKFNQEEAGLCCTLNTGVIVVIQDIHVTALLLAHVYLPNGQLWQKKKKFELS